MKMNKDEKLLAMMAVTIFASDEARSFTTARTSILDAIDILYEIKNPQDQVVSAAKFAGLNIGGVDNDQVSTSGLKKKNRKKLTPRKSPKSRGIIRKL